MSEEQKKILERQLWRIADELRGQMDADEFRDYILGFIFFKYLSEKQLLLATELLEGENESNYSTLTDVELIDAIKVESLETLGYFLPPHDLFDNIVMKGQSDFIIGDIQRIFDDIEQSTMGTDSEDDFNKLFEDIGLNSTKLGRTTDDRNELVAKILYHLNKINFNLTDSKSDILGDAYEYLISKFASGAGKSAGEFYTPQEVSMVLAKIVATGKTRIRSVYDPTCGSGSLLLRVGKEAEIAEYFGQERNRTTYNLARMNMILHGVHFSKLDIKQEDTLERPQHITKRFEAIVANPPFSAKWKGKDNPLNNSDDRFSQYGKLAPSSKADFAFVQHMVYQLADNGVMACILPHGVLFRGAAEGVIRKYLIDEMNCVDAIIGLPANLFYGTGIPTCILVIKKCRPESDNILFIDASEGFTKSGNQNKLNEEEHIKRIVDTYRKREVIDRYSYVATLAEVAENDYNLNIPRYVDTYEEEEEIDILAVQKQIVDINKDLSAVEQQMEKYLNEILRD